MPAPRFESDAYASQLRAEWGKYKPRTEASTKITRATSAPEPTPEGPKYTYGERVPLPGYVTAGSPQAIAAGAAVTHVSQYHAFFDNLLTALGLMYPTMPRGPGLRDEATALLGKTEMATEDAVRVQSSDEAARKEGEAADVFASFVSDSQTAFMADDGEWSPVVKASVANYAKPLSQLSSTAKALQASAASLKTRHPEIVGVDGKNLSRMYRFFTGLQRNEYSARQGVAAAVQDINKPRGELKNNTPVEAMNQLSVRKPGIEALAAGIVGLTDDRFSQAAIADRMQDALRSMVRASREGNNDTLRAAVRRANEAFRDLEAHVKGLEEDIGRLENHLDGFRVGLDLYAKYRQAFAYVAFRFE